MISMRSRTIDQIGLGDFIHIGHHLRRLLVALDYRNIVGVPTEDAGDVVGRVLRSAAQRYHMFNHSSGFSGNP